PTLSGHWLTTLACTKPKRRNAARPICGTNSAAGFADPPRARSQTFGLAFEFFAAFLARGFVGPTAVSADEVPVAASYLGRVCAEALVPDFDAVSRSIMRLVMP